MHGVAATQSSEQLSWKLHGPGALAAALLAFAVLWLCWQQHVPMAMRSTNLAEPTQLAASRAGDVRFEANRGQWPSKVRYRWRSAAQQVSILDDGMVFSARPQRGAGDGANTAPSTAQLRFVGARMGGSFSEREPLAAKLHHLQGADPARWLRDLPQFKQLRYAEIYPGIDLVYYGREGAFEFDLVVRPGADPTHIRLQSQGGTGAFVEAGGDLLLDGQGGVLRVHKPVLFQHIDGQRITLDAQWVLGADGALSFALPDYDRRYPLVIDPVFKLLYSTYLGGVHDDVVRDMVTDAQGNAYIVGHSGSEDWPVSGNAVQTRRKNLGVYVRNVVVTKFDAAGTLIWSTFLGGSVNDYGTSIAVDAAGNVVVAGNTNSPDFPTTPGALQRALQGGNSGFIATLSPDGSSLVQSTLMGGAGSPSIEGMALDGAGNIVVTGTALPGLVTTAGVYKPTLATGKAAFVARYSPTPAGPLQLQAASYYGTDAPEANSQVTGNVGFALALDANGAPWISGQSFTTKLPLTANALQTAPSALDANCVNGVLPLNSFGYVAKLSPDLRTLQYASYLTGYTRERALEACAEYALSVRVDAAGDVYVHGATASDKYPTTAGTAQPSYPGRGFREAYAAYVTKIKGDGSRVLWSTYLGGNAGTTFAGKAKLDATDGALWVPLVTSGGSNFPITADALQKTHGGGTFDAAYVQLDTATGTVKYSTFMGGTGDDIGIAVGIDAGGNAFVAGHTNSRNLTVTTNAFQPQYTVNAFDGNDWFVRVLGSGAISRVWPSVGGTGADVTLVGNGAGIQAGAGADLVGNGRTITALATSVSAANDEIQMTFALVDVPVGRYDLLIRNPDGTTLRRNAAFTVQAPGQPQVWASLIGRPVIRTGRATEFQLTYGNSGAVDAYFTAVWMSVPAGFSTPEIVTTVTDALRPESTFSDEVIFTTDADGSRKMVFLVPLIPAGGTGSLALRLTDNSASSKWVLSAYVEAPWFDTFNEARVALSAVAAGASPGTGCVAHASKAYLSNCLGFYSDRYAKIALQQILQFAKQEKLTVDAASMTASLHRGHAATLERMLLKVPAPVTPATSVRALSTLAADRRPLGGVILGPDGQPYVPTPPGTSVIVDSSGKPYNLPAPQSQPGIGSNKIFKGVTDGIGAALTFTQVVGQLAQLGNFNRYKDLCYLYGLGGSTPPGIKADLGQCVGGVQTLYVTLFCTHGKYSLGQEDVKCQPPDPCKNGAKPAAGSGCSGGDTGGSTDPNDKYGLPGDGSASHYISSSARAFPYQIAFENIAGASLPAADVVVSDQINTTKFDLSTLTLGNISWGPYRIDVPAGLNNYSTIYPVNDSVSVRIQGSLNSTSGLLKWTFTTIDPITKLPPSDPTLGFLPPNKNGTDGQGYVNFSISPKAGLPEGVRWENAASIVFDTNAPIATPTWVNTLDSTAPVSRVTSAVQKATTTEIDVAWSGNDVGSGVASYTVKVSDNGGAFADWQTAVAATSAVYPGVAGHTYGFTVAASDKAGNAETARLTSDMTVAVKDPTAPPVTPSSGGGGCTIAGADQHDAGLVLMALAALTLVWRRRKGAAQVGRPS